jgi:hypothetical protein
MNDNARDRLTSIAAGAEIVSRNARALPFKPPFTTAAQDELIDAEAALEAALQKVREAMAEYDRKEIAV